MVGNFKIKKMKTKDFKKQSAEGDRKDWVNKGMIWGGLIGITAGLGIALVWGGKNKQEKTGKLVVLASIGLISGLGMGYGGKKLMMS